MQRPTLENTSVRTVRDATHVFYAVARNQLPIITRRLDADERRAIKAGNVYVWEDRGANSESSGLGMERWTDGMSWGPSRVRDEFLYYTQKEYDPDNDPSSSWVPALRRRDPTPSSAPSYSHPMGPSRSIKRPEHLMKQTYSVHVFLPQDRPQGVMRKWHLTAYFAQETVDSMTPVSAVPGVGDVDVPEGWFRSARSSKTRRGGEPFGLGPFTFPTASGSHDGVLGAPSFGPGPSSNAPPPMYSPYSMYSFEPRQSPEAVSFGLRPASMPVTQAHPLDPGYGRDSTGSGGGVPSSWYPVASHPAYQLGPPLATASGSGSGSHDSTTPAYSSFSASAFRYQIDLRERQYEHEAPHMDHRSRSAASSASSGGSSDLPPTTPNNAHAEDGSMPRSFHPTAGVSLVPLQYLQNTSCPPRDPVDQVLLRRLGVLEIDGMENSEEVGVVVVEEM